MNAVVPDEYAEDKDDLGVCPYFLRYCSIEGHDPEATCVFGCYDEPQCVTCIPSDGWPSFNRWSAEQEIARQ